jgi:predicted RND superfamily exporter protein
MIVGLTLLAIGGYLRPTWPSELKAYLTNDQAESQSDPSLTEASQSKGPRTPMRSAGVRRDRGNTGDAYLVVRCTEFFTPRGSEAIRHVVDSLKKLPQVASVRWIEDTPPLNIFGLPEPILPQSKASPQRFQVAKKKAVSHPMVVGQTLSSDAETMLIQIGFDWRYVWEDSNCTTDLTEAAEAACKEFDGVTMQFDITGRVPLRLMMIQNRQTNQLKYQLIGYGMIFLMAVILFRGFTVVLVVASAPVVGVFWTLGFLRYFDLQDNPFSDVILPVLLSLVGFTDGVHMMVFIRRQLISGLAPKEACRKTIQAVGLACFLTSLTTAIGMGSLILARHEAVREFGWACVLGVAATWVSVMVMIPLICSMAWSKRLARGGERNFIDQKLSSIGIVISWTIRHARIASYASIGLMVALALVACRLRPDDRTSSILPTGSPAQLALAHLDKSMGGLDVCTINIQWTAESDHSPRAAAEVIRAVDLLVDEDPLLGHPLSLCRLIDALPGDGTSLDKMAMSDLLPPPLKLAFYDPEQFKATINFRVQDLGTAAYQSSFERLESKFQELEHRFPGYSMTLQGDRVWRWRDLYRIIVDLTTSLGTASIVIFFVMGIAFQSIRIGLISIVPNMVPLAFGAAWMALTSQPLEIVSVCAFTVCLGIAVDDTIHFLSRYVEEQEETTDHLQAIERSFQAVGTGMIMTTIVLVAGFSSVLTSDTRDHRIFASLGVITLVAALVCDLIMLPPLLAYFDRKKQ